LSVVLHRSARSLFNQRTFTARHAERRIWNRIPDGVRDNLIQLALDEPALSPRELAVRFTDTKCYFVSEASVYRLLKARDLIASPAFIVIKAAWGWFYLSTVLDDFSRYIVAWKLCTSMKAEDVTATLDLALQAAGWTRPSPSINPGSRRTTAPAISRATWLSGSAPATSNTCVARPIIR
jgi:putative transposase